MRDAMPHNRQAAGETAALAAIAELAHADAGLTIGAGKRAMLRARLARRMRAVGLARYDDYLALLQAPQGRAERQELIAALTTNVSYFFREVHHFDLLRDRILPPLIERAIQGGRVRLWSAGCAQGQEAYSIAMVLTEAFPDAARHDIRILGTDVDAGIVRRAEAGLFPIAALGEIPAGLHGRHVHIADDHFAVAPALRDLVRFRHHHLLGAWPMRSRFDVIFCRNVLIYFDLAAQTRLLGRFASALGEGGWLCLGHSERLSGPATSHFRAAGRTAHCKDSGSGAAR